MGNTQLLAYHRCPHSRRHCHTWALCQENCSTEYNTEMKAPLIGQFLLWAQQWIQAHENLVWWIAVSSLIMFLGTLVVLIAVIVTLPSEHFARNDKQHPTIPVDNRVLLICYKIFKNMVGIFFILAGLAMLVLPGQGLISLLLGISLTSFPGKHRLIRFIIRRKSVFRSANWLRKKFDRPPLKSP